MSLFGKKDNAAPNSQEKPAAPAPVPPQQQVRPAAPPDAKPAPPATSAPASAASTSHTVLGTSFVIKGEISAEENITIAGTVEGTIESSRDVIIAPEGRIKANIRGQNITIAGKVRGDVAATQKVDLTSTGQLEGNIQSPKLAIAESALFKGSIDMSAPAPKNQSKK